MSLNNSVDDFDVSRLIFCYSQVSAKLKSMPHTTPLLLQEVLTRLEADLGQGIVSTAMSLLVCARDGKLINCKCGYFRLGKISWKCWQVISHGGNFHDTTPISFTKAYWVYFSRWGNICKEDKSVKNSKITPTRKFPSLQYRYQAIRVIWWCTAQYKITFRCAIFANIKI